MNESDPWYLTVVRAQGMRLMRPERAWRPIVTVQVDQHHCHETVMGVDGQNPNLKEHFELRDVHSASRVTIHVWHLSQSKKKAKKRTLVASASRTLGELARLQGGERRKVAELRLQCKSATKRTPQNDATLLIKIRLPARVEQQMFELESMDESWEVSSLSSDARPSTQVSELPSMPSSPTDSTWPGPNRPLTNARVRRRRGYHIHSEDESSAYDDDNDCASTPPVFSDGDKDGYSDDDSLIGPIVPSAPRLQTWVQAIWPSLLPQHTQEIEVPPDMTLAETVLASFTIYYELKNAKTESQYERVFTRLQTEWTCVGGLLVALAAVDTAVFAIGPDAVIDVRSYARSAIAASSACSGLGIACDAWFLLRYNWAPLSTFTTRALDIYSTYKFFSLSARVPALCLFLSAVTLMLFMALVAFSVWPAGVLILCFGVGIVMALQFLVFGAVWLGACVTTGASVVDRAVKWAVGVEDRNAAETDCARETGKTSG